MPKNPQVSPYIYGNPTSAGFVRVAVCLIWLVTALQFDYSVLASLPSSTYRPVGLIDWLGSGFGYWATSESVLVWGRWILAALALYVLLGLPKSRLVCVGLALGALWLQSAVRSFSPYVNHAEIAALLILIALPLLPAFSGMAVSPERNTRNNWREAVLVPAVVIVATYLFVGAARVGTAGLEVFTDDTMLGWISIRQASPSDYPTKWFDWNSFVSLIRPYAGAGFALMTVLEILSPGVLVHNLFRKAWLAAVFVLHVFAFLVLNVLFWENVLILLAVVWNVAAITSPSLPRVRPDKADTEAFSRIDKVEGAVAYVFFDGVCNLCNRTVDWLMRKDSHRALGFGSLQGEASREIGLADEEGNLQSIVLVTERGLYTHSTAVLMSVSALGGVYGFARLLLLVPRPIRDLIYRFVAKRRFRLFGRRDSCRMPTPEEASRFVS